MKGLFSIISLFVFLAWVSMSGNISAKQKRYNDLDAGQLMDALKHCRNGRQKGCAVLQERLRSLTISCDRGFARACADVGEMYNKGWGVPKSPSASRAWFKKGCDQGDLYSCRTTAAFIYNGYGAPPDKREGTKLMKSTCERGNRTACTEFATIEKNRVWNKANSMSRRDWPTAYATCISQEQIERISAADACRRERNIGGGDLGVSNPMDIYACAIKRGYVATGRIEGFARHHNSQCYMKWPE